MASTIHLHIGGKICVAKCEEENGQIIIIQGIGIAMKTCVVFNIIVKKIKLKHPNLISQLLPECTSKSGRICSFYQKITIFDVYLKTALDLNNINYLCFARFSSKSSIMIYFFRICVYNTSINVSQESFMAL
jgi:hypothetical protein